MWQRIQTKDVVVSLALILITIFNFIPVGHCLFEDQVGKFDWYVLQINSIKKNA